MRAARHPHPLPPTISGRKMVVFRDADFGR
jgi:hypothetical protein